VAAVYPEHGGDEAAWERILRDYALVSLALPGIRVLIVGDCNFHFKHYLLRDAGCTCSHCRQPAADCRIESAVRRAGLAPYNSAVQTHSSGTLIDLGIGRADQPIPVRTLPRRIADSDHHVVIAKVPAAVRLNYEQGLGRVMWASGKEWHKALASVQRCLAAAADATALATQEVLEAGDKVPIKRRRMILEAAAWLREALYVLAGHSGLATVHRQPNGRRETFNVPARKEGQSEVEHAEEIDRYCWHLRARAATQHAALCSSDPAQANRFLAGLRWWMLGGRQWDLSEWCKRSPRI
jgi:hypothetical protein